METVNKHTRAGKHGKIIVCPHCNGSFAVHHFDWLGLLCLFCGKEVPKKEWLIAYTK